MRRLTRGTIREAKNILTLTRARTSGVGGAAVSIPQPTAQNEMIIASATPAWSLLAAPAAEGQALIMGADPFTPAWGTTFPTVIQFDAGLTFGGATGVNVVTVPDNAAQAMHLVDAGATEYLRIISTDAQPVVVFNEGGADVDFRVEASGQPAALKVDGATGWVGILDASPSAPLDVNGAIWGGYNTDVRCYLGRAAVGWCGVNDQAAFGHLDAMGTTGFALKQIAVGATVLNAATGQILYLNVGDVHRVSLAAGAVVFNETGIDVDHRWEAVGQANALFIQGSDGWVALGHNAPERMLHIKSDTANTANIILEEYLNTTSGPDVFQRKGRGTIASPLDVAVDDHLGAWYFSGYRNSDWRNAAVIAGTANALGASVVRGGLSFQTANAAGTLVEQMTIDEDGNVHIQENSAAVRLSGTFTLHFVIPEPTVETVAQLRITWDCTVTRVDSNVTGGTSCTFNIEERGTLGSAGTDILSSDMVADANGESVTSSFNNSSMAEGNHWAFDVSAVSGAVDYVSISLTVTID